MDEPTTSGFLAFVALVVGAVFKGGWDAVRARTAASATVTTAEIADEAKIRGELWDAISKMQARMDALTKDLDAARKEHIVLMQEHATLKGEYIALKREHDTLLVRYAELERRVNVA
jgi:hypothetical protein